MRATTKNNPIRGQTHEEIHLEMINFTRINYHSGANLGVDFAINMPYGAV